MKVLDLAKRYNQFQNNVGQFVEVDIDHIVATLFAESFRKIANGTTLVAKRSDLKNQLMILRDQSGKWTIEPKEEVVFQDTMRCLIRYHLISANYGLFDVMATLRANSDDLIEEVDEIYYKVAS